MSTSGTINATGSAAMGPSTVMYNNYVQAANTPTVAPRSSPSGTPEKPKKWKTILKQMMFGKKEKRVFVLY